MSLTSNDLLRPRRAYFPRWALTLMLSVTLIACSADPGANETSTQPAPEEPAQAVDLQEVTLLLPFPIGAGWPDLVAAQTVGYFEAEGLVVNAEAAEGSEFVVQQLIANNFKYGNATVTSIIAGAAVDPRLRVLHCNQAKSPYKIVVLDDSPIQKIADFEGETLGVSAISGGERPIVDASLQDVGLEPNTDVQLLAIGDAGPQSFEAISNGTVAGYASAVSDLGPLEAMGLSFRDLTPQKYANIQGGCLFVTEDTLADPASRRVAEGIARGWSKGGLFMATNPEAVLEMVCDRFPESCTDEEFAQSNHAMRVNQATPTDPNDPFGTVTPDTWETAIALLYDAAVIESPVNADELVGQEFEWPDYDTNEVIADAETWGR